MPGVQRPIRHITNSLQWGFQQNVEINILWAIRDACAKFMGTEVKFMEHEKQLFHSSL